MSLNHPRPSPLPPGVSWGPGAQSFSLFGVLWPSWHTLRSASHSFQKVYNVSYNLPRCTLLKVNRALTTIFGNTGSGQSVHCPTCRVAVIVHYALLEEARTVMSLPWEGSVFEFWVPCHRLPAVSKFKRWMSWSHLLMEQMRWSIQTF